MTSKLNTSKNSHVRGKKWLLFTKQWSKSLILIQLLECVQNTHTHTHKQLFPPPPSAQLVHLFHVTVTACWHVVLFPPRLCAEPPRKRARTRVSSCRSTRIKAEFVLFRSSFLFLSPIQVWHIKKMMIIQKTCCRLSSQVRKNNKLILSKWWQ